MWRRPVPGPRRPASRGEMQETEHHPEQPQVCKHGKNPRGGGKDEGASSGAVEKNAETCAKDEKIPQCKNIHRAKQREEHEILRPRGQPCESRCAQGESRCIPPPGCGGAEIARTEWYLRGQLPLQTLKADIDYGFTEAFTTYGQIGIKVWIYKGTVEKLKMTSQTAEVEEI